MVSFLPKCGIGSFLDHHDTKEAVDALKSSNISMDRISIINHNTDEENNLAISEDKYVKNKTINGILKGAITFGTLGSISGIVISLGSLGLPGVSNVVSIAIRSILVGVLAGGFYGIVAGCILGAILGNGISRQQAKIYSDQLNNGDDLIIIEGSKDEIIKAESILKACKVQDWQVYQTT